MLRSCIRLLRTRGLDFFKSIDLIDLCELKNCVMVLKLLGNYSKSSEQKLCFMFLLKLNSKICFPEFFCLTSRNNVFSIFDEELLENVGEISCV